MHILVVDHSPISRMVIRKELEQGGYTVTEADSEEEALRQFREVRPRLVTLNSGQSGESRRELMREFRRIETEGDSFISADYTPVVVVTGSAAEAELEPWEGMVSAIVSKPFMPGVLLEQVHDVLEPVAMWNGATVLLADDSRPSRLHLSQLAQSLGATVLEATTGEQALSLAEQHAGSLDLAILDQHMPDIAGDEVCRRMRDRPEFKNLPIILVSAADNQSALRGYYEAGATDYFSKPFFQDEFEARTAVHLRVTRLTRSLAGWKRRMEGHLDLARQVQRAAIRPAPAIAHAQVGVAFQPQAQVSGDIYDCTVMPSGALRAFVADATGHGVDAALMTTMVLAGLASTDANAAPLPVLETLHGLLSSRLGERFVTGCCMQLTPEGVLTVASAGHPAPLLLRRNGSVEVLNSEGGPPLGMFPIAFQALERVVTLAPGDRLLLYTDGLAEYPQSSGEHYGLERLIESLRRTSALPVHDAVQGILHSVWQEAEQDAQDDDLTALLIAYR